MEIMEKICVIEAGEFLLGIDTASIVSKRDVGSVLSDKQGNNAPLFHLASFLSMQSLPVPNINGVVIEVQNTAGVFTTLLVDRVIGEIVTPSHFEQLPLLYPELAIKCCPQVFIHDEQVVLLLNVAELISLGEKMQTAHGIFSLDDFHNMIVEAESETETIIEETDISPDMNTAANSSNPADENVVSGGIQVDIAASSPEDTPSVDLPEPLITETKTVQPKTKIDEIAFNKIVVWTIGEYLNCDKSKPIAITVNMIPLGLLHQQEPGDKIVQTLINKTIRRCQKSTREKLQLLRRSTS